MHTNVVRNRTELCFAYVFCIDWSEKESLRGRISRPGFFELEFESAEETVENGEEEEEG